jgi:hypothetical protein
LTDLDGGISTRSDAFRTDDAWHDVVSYETAIKHFRQWWACWSPATSWESRCQTSALGTQFP